MSSARLAFLPWLRRGLATSLPAAPTLPRSATATVSFQVAGEHVERRLQLRGPGQVAALSSGAVTRTWPEADAAEVEPNLFVHVELSDADLPWRFTPAGPDGDGRLRPWLVLVVVPEDEATLAAGANRSVLEVSARELPDLADSWAWAHVQVAVPDAGLADVSALLDAEPERFTARLLCPRRLDAERRYLAAVVPAFDAGVRAGLGEPLDDDATLADAWSSGAETVRLPVYFSWRFSTGPAGDFESLARRIAPVELAPPIGTAALDVGAPGGSLPSGGGVTFCGALVPAVVDTAPRPGPADFDAALRALLDSGSGVLEAPAGDTVDDDPVVAPPCYGTPQQDVPALPGAGWLPEVNLAPALRAAAGIGAALVRAADERFAAEAWRQLEGIREVNRALRRAQLARAVTGRLAARLERTDDGTFLQLTRPAHARVAVDGGTARAALAATDVPAGLVSAAMQRVTRPGAVVERTLRSAALAPTAAAQTVAFLRGLADVSFAIARVPLGTVLASEVPKVKLSGTVDDGGPATPTGPRRGPTSRRTRARRGPRAARTGPSLLSETAAPRIRVGGRELSAPTGLLIEAAPAVLVTPRTPEPSPATATRVRRAFDPARDLSDRLGARLRLPAALSVDVGRVAAVRAEVRFPDPLALDLARRDPRLLLPGLADIPLESASLLVENKRFVQSLLAGANHAWASEVVWREIPTDPSATPMRKFWDSRSDSDDIPAIGSWDPAAPIGELTPAASRDVGVVLLLKATLLRRYPDLLVYARPARWQGGQRVPDESTAALPLFEGPLAAGTRFYGFGIDIDDARGAADPTRGAPGWFFVLEERATRPRFGLDVGEPADASAVPTGADDLSWYHLWPVTDGEERYAPAGGRAAGFALGGARWGADAGQQARLSLQRPFRLVLHASALLP